jgi:Domain of unknown function (DUF1833)
MRSFSSAALQAMLAQETGQAFIVLLTLDHPTLEAPLRVTSDAVNTISGGETFVQFPFTIGFPDDRADQVTQTSLTIDAVDRSVVAAIRSIGNLAPTVKFQIVLAATPDTVEVEWTMTMRDVTYDEMQVTGRLSFEEIMIEPFPVDLVTPGTLPGAFEIDQ